MPDPFLKKAEAWLLELLEIPGGSCHEAEVVKYLTAKLLAAGANADCLAIDDVQRRSPRGGDAGNLILKLPGTLAGPRRMLMAHTDTVPLCVGTKPVRRGNFIVPADKSKGLGADDRAGSAVVLATALEILESGLPHPPLTFYWTVQEEIGLYGARYAKTSMLGKPQLAFNFDGGSAEKVTIGATGGYRMDIQVRGIAAHAGAAPEQGVSAVTTAALAIADLHRGGWHGKIEKDGRTGTSNIGVIRGGEATNVVTPFVEIRAEARSHNTVFRGRIISAIEKAFRQAAKKVKNAKRQTGEVTISGHLDYEAFRLDPKEPCVRTAEAAIRDLGLTPQRAISNGGLDANWLSARGIPTVSLGCGQENAHTPNERLCLPEFHKACRIGLSLATGK
jgi:tripeptide aminopeptidase